MSQPTRWQAMAQHTDLDAWRGTNALDNELFIAGFRITGGELPGWTLHHARRIAEPGWPPGVQTIWRAAGPDALLRLDLYECPSRLVAHHLLVLLLLDYQAPTITRLTPAPAGDIAFGGPGRSSALLARANVVLSANRAGRDPVDAWAVAGVLDDVLCDRLGEPITIKWRGAEPSSVGSWAAFEDVPYRHGRPEWLQVFSGSGTVLEQDGRLWYRHDLPGPVDLAGYSRPVPGGTPHDPPLARR